MQQINYNADFEVVGPIGNYGNVICKKITKSFIDGKGDIQEFSAYVYNILLKDKSFVSDEWFDFYNYEWNGNCTIGFSRSNLECAEMWSTIPSYCSENVIYKEYTYRWGAINSSGILAVKPMYDRLSFNNENSYTAYHNGELGYIDSTNGKHITPIVFTHAQPFFENKAAAEFNGKMGYVDRNKIMKNPKNEDEWAIAPKFDIAGDFENGHATVRINGQSFIIDENGNICSQTYKNPENRSKQHVQLKKINKSN